MRDYLKLYINDAQVDPITDNTLVDFPRRRSRRRPHLMGSAATSSGR